MSSADIAQIVRPFLLALADNRDLGLLVEGADGRVLLVSHSLCSLFGSTMPSESWSGLPIGHVFVQMATFFDDPDGFLDGINLQKMRGAPVLDEHLTLSNGSRLRRDYLPVLQAGAAVGHIWILDRPAGDSQAVAAVRRYYEHVLAALPAQLAIFSPTGVYEYVTPSAISDAQTREWLIGRTDVDYGVRRGLSPSLVAERRKRISDTAVRGTPSQFEESIVTKSGETRYFRRFTAPVFDDDGVVLKILGYGLDITDERKMERQLRLAQTMDVVGRLAGGVAHDFNNLLTIIMGFAQSVRESLPPEAPEIFEIEQVLEAGSRAADLTKQLLALSRERVIERVAFDLNDVVRRTILLLGRLLGERVRVQTDCAAEPMVVFGDTGQLQQVLVNLSVNARDAMPDGGTLLITTRRRLLSDEAEARTLGLTRGSYVELAVADTGSGMTDETQRHLFEPFFTTKSVGMGTGLGMSIVYGIVTGIGGQIVVESALNKGTTMRVLLPEHLARPTDARASAERTSAPRGTEHIMVAEDNPGVCRLVSSFLAGLGYTVHAAADGGEALRIAESLDQPVHLLISDVGLPILNGIGLADRLRDRWPDLKVLLASGYAASTLVQTESLRLGANFIAKPFKVVELALIVRRTLDSAP